MWPANDGFAADPTRRGRGNRPPYASGIMLSTRRPKHCLTVSQLTRRKTMEKLRAPTSPKQAKAYSRTHAEKFLKLGWTIGIEVKQRTARHTNGCSTGHTILTRSDPALANRAACVGNRAGNCMAHTSSSPPSTPTRTASRWRSTAARPNAAAN